MANILIGTMGFVGHINPGLPIARRLVERGHTVWWYTTRKYQSKIEATGATYVPMQAGLDFDDADLDAILPGRQQRQGIAQLKYDIKQVFLATIPGYAEDLEAVTAVFQPDVLLVDNAFGAANVLHYRTGVPWAAFGVMPLSLPSRDTAPMGLGLLPDASLLGRLRNRALNVLMNKVVFREVNAYKNTLLTGLGLPASNEGVFDSTSPFLFLQSTDPAFEYPRSDLPDQVHFIGPFLPDAPQDFVAPAWWNEMVNSPRPVVHVTQGTVSTESAQLLIPTIQALADQDVLVVVTTGGKPVETLGLATLPANVRVESFIPHYHLLPHVSIMVTNGGYGGVQIALAHGIPLVVAGATEDKPEVANRVAWSGTGINLKTNTPAPQQVRSAVQTLLSDPSYRANARALQTKLRRYDAATAASVLLERLAHTQQPVSRSSIRTTHEIQAVHA